MNPCITRKRALAALAILAVIGSLNWLAAYLFGCAQVEEYLKIEHGHEGSIAQTTEAPYPFFIRNHLSTDQTKAPGNPFEIERDYLYLFGLYREIGGRTIPK